MDNGTGLGVIPVFALYFFPAILAVVQRRRQANAIFVLNLFLGWTVIGWIGALVWSAVKDQQA